MTKDRKQEIENATPEAPIVLSVEEIAELRLASKHRFQMNVGAGRFLLVPNEKGREHFARMRSMLEVGYSHAEIAEAMGVRDTTVTRFLETQSRIDRVKLLKDKGLGNVFIAREVGLSESSVRAILR